MTTAQRVRDIGLLLAAVAVAYHLAFSWAGFSPTDEGWLHAMARRLASGQVPHRDFISIRPVGSALLHLPELVLGGNAVLWLSRGVVWVQWLLIGWAWVELAARATGVRPGRLETALLATASASVIGSRFPLMAWHTTDGVMCVTLGLLAVVGGGRGAWAGWLAIGFAGLCKQNFLACAVVAPLFLGRAREPLAWALEALPVGAYVAWVTLAGGWHPMVVQLTALTGALYPAFLRYVQGPAFFPAALAAALAFVVLEAPGERLRAWPRALAAVQRALRVGVCAVVVLVAGYVALDAALDLTHGAVGGAIGPDRAVDDVTLAVVLGAVVVEALAVPAREGLALAALALVVAWSSAISVGWPYPSAMAGPLAVLALFWLRRGARADALLAEHARWLRPAGSLALALFAVAGLVTARVHPYRDRPAAELTRKLYPALPGGRFIYTSTPTWEYVAELAALRKRVAPRVVVPLPDVAVAWLGSPEPNPLPIDWPIDVELGALENYERYLAAVDAARGHAVFALSMVRAEGLANPAGPPPQDSSWPNTALIGIRQHLKPVARTKFFEVLE